MTEVGSVYGEALYSLACEEGLAETILRQLRTLDSCFAQEPDFIQLLCIQNLISVNMSYNVTAFETRINRRVNIAR